MVNENFMAMEGQEEDGDEEEVEEVLPKEKPKEAEAVVSVAEVTIANVIEEPKHKEKQKEPGKKEEKLLDPKRVLEAALFMSAKPMTLEELQRFSGIAAPGHVKGLLEELQKELEEKGSAVELREETDGWIFRLRNEYAKRVAPLAQEAEVGKSALKVLAYIASNDGILQSKVVGALGSTVYEYVGELLEKGFLVKAKKGRSFSLRVTQKFKDYFAT